MKKLTQAEERRKQAALTIVKTLSEETSVVAKPLSKVDIVNIPNNAEPAIKDWIRKYKKHIVYGSGAMATHSIHARRPQDLDLVIDSPRVAASAFAKILRSKGHKVKVNYDPTWGSYVVQVGNREGGCVAAIDIHPLKGFEGKYEFYGSSLPPVIQKGINLQRAGDQLLRKANAITQRHKDGSMGAAPHRELKDTIDFITTTELLLASMELKSNAQLAKAKKIKEELKIWKTHLRTLQKGKESAVKRKPLSITRQKKFVAKAVKNPGKDIDDMIFENGKVILRKIPIRKIEKKVKSLYNNFKQPYVQSPYTEVEKRKLKKAKSHVVDWAEEMVKNITG